MTGTPDFRTSAHNGGSVNPGSGAGAATMECPLCQGYACEEGCGECWDANVGPDSHKVCRRCRGAGVIQPELPENGSEGAAS